MASSFLDKKTPFNLLDYIDERGRVVSRIVQEGNYDIAISSEYHLMRYCDKCIEYRHRIRILPSWQPRRP